MLGVSNDVTFMCGKNVPYVLVQVSICYARSDIVDQSSAIVVLHRRELK